MNSIKFASRILKPLWRLTCRSSPVLLTIKHHNTRVFLPYMSPSGHKFDFTQSYGRSYGGIVPVLIEFTGGNWFRLVTCLPTNNLTGE